MDQVASTQDRGTRHLGSIPNLATDLLHGLIKEILSVFFLVLLPSPSECIYETFLDQGKVLSVCICLEQGGIQFQVKGYNCQSSIVSNTWIWMSRLAENVQGEKLYFRV